MDPRLLTRSTARHLETFAEHKVGAFTLHDLRRTVRTGLAKLGIRPDIAERCLNHAQPGIIATYDTHQYLEEKRDALTQWADHLEGASRGNPLLSSPE
jgi:integrase